MVGVLLILVGLKLVFDFLAASNPFWMSLSSCFATVCWFVVWVDIYVIVCVYSITVKNFH